jgi:hypothetical protein
MQDPDNVIKLGNVEHSVRAIEVLCHQLDNARADVIPRLEVGGQKSALDSIERKSEIVAYRLRERTNDIANIPNPSKTL